jgi:hypothetical protein
MLLHTLYMPTVLDGLCEKKKEKNYWRPSNSAGQAAKPPRRKESAAAEGRPFPLFNFLAL